MWVSAGHRTGEQQSSRMQLHGINLSARKCSGKMCDVKTQPVRAEKENCAGVARDDSAIYSGTTESGASYAGQGYEWSVGQVGEYAEEDADEGTGYGSNNDGSDEAYVDREEHIAPYLCEIVEESEQSNEPVDKAFQCPRCSKRFSRLTYLKQHGMTHSDVKPFPCEQCPMRFKKLSHLKTHRLTHATDTPYRCAICPKRFTQVASLRAHSLVHTGIRPFQCRACAKRFSKLYSLQRHELTHADSKPHACAVCRRRFCDVSNLRRHELTHVDSKPHACPRCPRRFNQHAHLKRHSLTHSNAY